MVKSASKMNKSKVDLIRSTLDFHSQYFLFCCGLFRYLFIIGEGLFYRDGLVSQVTIPGSASVP